MKKLQVTLYLLTNSYFLPKRKDKRQRFLHSSLLAHILLEVLANTLWQEINRIKIGKWRTKSFFIHYDVIVCIKMSKRVFLKVTRTYLVNFKIMLK